MYDVVESGVEEHGIEKKNVVRGSRVIAKEGDRGWAETKTRHDIPGTITT